MTTEIGLLTDVKNLQTQLVSLSKTDADYPQEWRYMPDAPQTIYALGNIALLKERKLAVVGSRTTSSNVLKLGEKICAELSNELVIGQVLFAVTIVLRFPIQRSWRLPVHSVSM